MMAGRPPLILQHGTTRQRADRILAQGPNPNFIEPGGTMYDAAAGFSTAEAGASDVGLLTPEDYARYKAINFPGEGGPVILEIEVPDWIVDIVLSDPGLEAGAGSGDIRFEPGKGLEELLQEWPNLPKRIIPL